MANRVVGRVLEAVAEKLVKTVSDAAGTVAKALPEAPKNEPGSGDRKQRAKNAPVTSPRPPPPQKGTAARRDLGSGKLSRPSASPAGLQKVKRRVASKVKRGQKHR